jgi:RsiW-degrading membrane proteinase PrsW (M82 family)
MSLRKFCNPLFIVYIYITIVLITFVNTKYVYSEKMPKTIYAVIYISFFWGFAIMLNIALLKTIFTDPGKVP